MKKLIAILAISSLLWVSVITPAKAWVLPVLARAGVYVLDKVAALSTAQKINYGASVAVHAVVASLVLTDDDQPPATDGSNTMLQIQLDPDTPLIKPASAATQPATVAATPQEQVVSDLQVSYYHSGSGCWNTGTTYYPSKDALGAAMASQCTSAPTSYTYTGFSGNYVMFQRYDDGVLAANTNKFWYSTASCATGSTWNGSDCVQTVYTCPANYTLSGQTCNSTMTEPLDNKVRINRTGNTFSKDSTDPDPLPDNVTIAGGNTVTAKTCGFDSAHPCPSTIPPKTVQVRADTNGTVSIISAQPTANSNTEVKGVTLSAPAGENNPPVVVGTKEELIPGTGGTIGELDDTTPASDGTNVLNLPANMATTDKQCGYDAAHPCAVTLGDFGDLGTNDLPSTDLDTAADAHKAIIDGIGEGGDHGFEWSWNPFDTLTTGGCSAPTFMAAGKNWLNLDDFCTKVAYIRTFMEFMLYIATGYGLFNIMTGRRELE